MEVQKIFQETVALLTQLLIKHEYRQFPSGAIMLDIWVEGHFYVLQFEDHIGISEINEDNPGFDTRPDEAFYTETAFKYKLDSILAALKNNQ